MIAEVFNNKNVLAKGPRNFPGLFFCRNPAFDVPYFDMLKNKWFGILILVVVISIMIAGLSAITITIIIKFYGKQVSATVIEVPRECSKRNSIKVVYAGDFQYLGISRKDCSEGAYKPGQVITLLKLDQFDELVWPDSKPEWALVILVGLLVLIFFQVKAEIKKEALEKAKKATRQPKHKKRPRPAR